MPIPTTNQMVLPVLQYIADGEEYRRSDIIDMIVENFSLTEDERKRLSKSGQMERSLCRKGYIERSREKHYRITSLGLDFFNQNSEEILNLETNTETNENPSASSSEENREAGEDNQQPERSIEENYQQIREQLAEELLQQVKDNTPTFFEELVIDLLVAMGYGGSREDAEAVGRSHDGGIDGIIKEDRLGLDVIYVQAKRWKKNIPEEDIRDFTGALTAKGVQKGIFITTSDFTKAAKKFAETMTAKKVILINGDQLAEYMINHDVGVSVEKTYEIKRVDSDYFTENAENP